MTHFTLPLDIASLEIIAQSSDSQKNIIFEVKSKCSETACRKCGKPATKRYGYSAVVDIRHTSILDTPVYLRIKPVRYQWEHCDDHPTTTEQYGWCAKGGKMTKALEEYIMRCVINSTVSDVARKERISYRSVVRAINNSVGLQVDWSKYNELTFISYMDHLFILYE